MNVPELLQRPSNLVALGGIVAGAAAIVLFPSQIGIGAVIILGCATYLMLRKTLSTAGSPSLERSHRQRRLLMIAFWGLFAASGWLYQTQSLYHRPLAYFVVVALMAGIVALEILFYRESHGNRRVYVILLHVLLLSTSIRLGILLEYPSLSGADAFFHARMTQSIVDTGHMPGVEISGKYAVSGGFHAAVAMTQVLTSLGTKAALLLTVGLNALLSTTFIYYVGRKIAGPQVGLMALLLANIVDFLIIEGAVNLAPGTLATSFFMMMLYLIAKPELRTGGGVLLALLAASLVMTHQMNAFVAVLSLLLLYLISRGSRALYGHRQQIRLPLKYVLLALGFLVASYALDYGAGSFLITMLQELRSTPLPLAIQPGSSVGSSVRSSVESSVTISTHFDIWTNVSFHLGYLVILYFTIIGMLRWLSSRVDWKLTTALVGLVLFVMVYGIPALGIRNFITGRWLTVFSPFIVVPAAAAMVRLVQYLKPHLRAITVLGTLSLIAFFMITTSSVNKDNPILGKQRMHRDQYMASEISSIATINTYYSGLIVTDRSYTSGIMRQIEMNSDYLDFSTEYLDGGGVGDPSGTMVIIREAIFEEPVRINLPGQTFETRMVVDRRFEERFQSSDYNRIYASATVAGYTSR